MAIRLQGWSEPTPLFTSPQIGAMFETLVLAGIVKFINNYRKDWQLFFWRTKDGEEIDFVLQTAPGKIHAFEIKLAIQGLNSAIPYPASFQKHFAPESPLIGITFGGERLALSKDCMALPIAELCDYLLGI